MNYLINQLFQDHFYSRIDKHLCETKSVLKDIKKTNDEMINSCDLISKSLSNCIDESNKVLKRENV